MNLRPLICLSAMLLTSVGCCHTQCVSSNPCDPCGGGGGCCLTNWLHTKIASCRARNCCQNYSWSDDCSACSICGGGNCGMSGSVIDGSVGSYGGGGGSSCGCGQSHGSTMNYAPSSPTPAQAVPSNIQPTPAPNSSAPMPPANNEPIPAPGSTDSTTFQRPANGQVQHVSVEEFHRLPGVVTSGPTQSSVPSMGLTTPPPLSTVSAPPKANTVTQAQWAPVNR
ncbi:MAG: hypothetical protein U0941_20755 [Planctomycetaceae bacterium]